MTDDDFAAWVDADGFSAPQPKTYEPSQKPPMHAHDFDARLLVTGGALRMVFDTTAVELRPGDECDVPSGTRHSEQGGPDGATAVLAKRDTAV